MEGGRREEGEERRGVVELMFLDGTEAKVYTLNTYVVMVEL